jgi:hypothetical protein
VTSKQLLKEFHQRTKYLSYFVANYRAFRLGSGLYRTVFGIWDSEKWVMKVANSAEGADANRDEWQVWCYLRERHKSNRLLAPCLGISDDGSVLLMRRTTICNEAQVPKRVPVWMTDLKVQNWGMMDGRAVCHDYSTHLIMENTCSDKTKKARWWDANR